MNRRAQRIIPWKSSGLVVLSSKNQVLPAQLLSIYKGVSDVKLNPPFQDNKYKKIKNQYKRRYTVFMMRFACESLAG